MKEVIVISRKISLPGKRTRAYELLELTAIFGEFPTTLLPRLSSSESYTRKLILSLKGKGLLKTYYADGLRGLRPTITAKRLFLADNPERFSACIEENAGEILTNKTKHYFLLDGNYEHFYFVTNDERGELLLRLLCNPDLCDALDELLASDLYPADYGYLVENDAVTEDGVPVLFAYNCDLYQIKKAHKPDKNRRHHRI